ncbi:hypothetical protein KSP39_PZI008186 [Platanthera zijinensis]|uniref:SOSEKI DIX-like domain-containing protein n=1 Tax=Platanthera zijinensis TaxID=2320716 RepID=A0AAP0G8I0_9ASPA
MNWDSNRRTHHHWRLFRNSPEMEGRMRRNEAQLSPDRYVVWREPSGNRRMPPQEGTAVPVVYYLCNDSLLEHPNFIEVPFSSTDGLYLRDVISRLTVLRGNQMPAMYSWSCKRIYRKRFVWQDLAEDDLIMPAHGSDYILKGSLILDQIPAVSLKRSSNNPVFQKNLGLPPKDHFLYSRKHEASSFSSPVTTTREMKPLSPSRPSSPHPLGDDIPRPSHQSSITPIGAPDSSSHTENVGEKKTPGSQTTIDSTNNEFSQAIMKEKTSQTPVLWNTGMDTLISLIRAEVSDSFRGTEEKRFSQSKEKMKKTNALLQLITCRLFVEKINIF